MNKLSVIIVSAGVDLWDTLTVPAVSGLREFGDPRDEIIVVDNGGLGRGNVNFPCLVPYAPAVNAAARVATGDRLFILNNDIVVTGPYREHLGAYPLEGISIQPDTRHGGFVTGWSISIDRGLWDLLNGFDEQFRNSYEDVDLSRRAMLLGYKLHEISPPIEHMSGKSRQALREIAQAPHKANKTLFYQKLRRMQCLSASTPT